MKTIDSKPTVNLTEKDDDLSSRMNIIKEGVKWEWIGTIPETCNICGKELVETFVYGKSKFGSWDIMCTSCFIEHGTAFGGGKGHLYNTLGKRLI